jgi:hypothetical protein
MFLPRLFLFLSIASALSGQFLGVTQNDHNLSASLVLITPAQDRVSLQRLYDFEQQVAPFGGGRQGECVEI